MNKLPAPPTDDGLGFHVQACLHDGKVVYCIDYRDSNGHWRRELVTPAANGSIEWTFPPDMAAIPGLHGTKTSSPKLVRGKDGLWRYAL